MYAFLEGAHFVENKPLRDQPIVTIRSPRPSTSNARWMSLGAARRHLTTLLVRDLAPAIVVGAAVGLLLTYNFSHLLRSLMTGVRVFDPVIYGVTIVMLFVVAGFAAWLPLRAAYRIDPAVVLRSE